MKIRQGFVTNSSSSSFIIKTKDKAPEQFLQHLKEYTIENVDEWYKERIEYCSPFGYWDEERDKEMIEFMGLTDKQVFLLTLEKENLIYEYKNIVEKLKDIKEEEFIYNLYCDRDWLSNQPELYKYIRSKEHELINYQTDL